MTLKYSILTFRTDLTNPKTESPFAILIEGKEDSGAFLAIGYRELLSKEDLGPLGNSMVRNLQDILKDEVEKQIRSMTPDEWAVDKISALNLWNIRATPPLQHKKGPFQEIVSAAYDLFKKIMQEELQRRKIVVQGHLASNRLRFTFDEIPRSQMMDEPVAASI